MCVRVSVAFSRWLRYLYERLEFLSSPSRMRMFELEAMLLHRLCTRLQHKAQQSDGIRVSHTSWL